MEIKQKLLSEIISSSGVFQHKYSRAYQTFMSVCDLEIKSDNKFLTKFGNRIKEIQSKKDKLYHDIPLLVLEQYFLRNSEKLSLELYIEYENKSYPDLKVYRLYELLEAFFNEIFCLAVEIADYYSYEVKYNKKYDLNSDEDVF